MNAPCPGSCGRLDTRPYACGPRCPEHTPAKRLGHPEPDVARYCAPYRCYCGRDVCDAVIGPVEPIVENIVDLRVKASGKRRSRSLEEYRDAQANTSGGAA